MAAYNKPKNWDGKDLKGVWVVSIKKDGVRAFIKDGIALSRAGKPLYNLEGIEDGDYEIFIEDWNTTVSRVRTQEGEPIGQHRAYSLDPLDNNLVYHVAYDGLSRNTILNFLDLVTLDGHEGLVLRQGDKWIKVKPRDNTDIEVTGVKLGSGRIFGLLGAFTTELGNVGTGFTDKQRKELLGTPIGSMIEVSHRGFTKAGNFKEPSFVRLRFDKSN